MGGKQRALDKFAIVARKGSVRLKKMHFVDEKGS
jgi:hypothetical protein